MVKRAERPNAEDIKEKQQCQRAELRAELEEKLSDESLRQFDLMSELWDSGKMQEMLDSGDFSDIPDELRPTTTNRLRCRSERRESALIRIPSAAGPLP